MTVNTLYKGPTEMNPTASERHVTFSIDVILIARMLAHYTKLGRNPEWE